MMKTSRLWIGALAGAAALASITGVRALETGIHSGVEKGGMLSAFEPTHVTGADKHTQTCPVCKYPMNPAVQVWVNTDSDKNVATIIETLEKATKANAAKKLKAFVVYVNTDKRPAKEVEAKLEKLGSALKVQNVALAYLPGPQAEAVTDYQINTDAKVKNTVFVYKNRKVDTKFVNFTADKPSLDALNAAIKRVAQ
jgi:hypothetical protein